MSIEVELNRKAGRVCQAAIQGQMHCPLIVRQTSEDVLVGNVFGLLRLMRPHLWLNPLLNRGLGVQRFRQVWFQDWTLRFWQRQARYPQELLDFREGRTEPDLILEWENPPTTVWIEAKYHSPLAEGTSHARSNDQVIRGIRTLLAATGHVQPHRLFETPRRRAVWLALLSYKPDPVMETYQDIQRLRACLPEDGVLRSLPEAPFVGTITWQDIAEVLAESAGLLTPTEMAIRDRLQAYLQMKNHLPLP